MELIKNGSMIFLSMLLIFACQQEKEKVNFNKEEISVLDSLLVLPLTGWVVPKTKH